jgi:hypothetical protein
LIGNGHGKETGNDKSRSRSLRLCALCRRVVFGEVK